MTAAILAAIDAGYGRSLLIHYFAARIGRPIQVNGTLQAHILTRYPRIVAEDVAIGNPPWMPAGLAAKVDKVTVILTLPGFGHPSGIADLEMEGATLHLARDAAGSSNWQLNDPRKPATRTQSSIVRSISIPNAHLVLEDARRNLQFVGVASAQSSSGPAAGQPLRIDGAGQLNGREVKIKITADPLELASHDSPYHFSLSERSSGSRLEVRVALPQPFDFDLVDAAFEATGADLEDLYFLTGVKLLDTGDYRLSGRASRRGAYTQYSNLLATFGQSDVHGTISLDSSGARLKMELALNSKVLHLADFGLRAAGRTSEPPSSLLLSEAALSPHVLRVADSTLRFRAQRVDVGRLPLYDVALKGSVEHGVLTVAPLLAEVLGGKIDARLTLDARKNIPTANVDLKATDLQLAQFPHKDSANPPIEGPIQARVTVTGEGSSVHEVAASANGTVTALLKNGAIRASIAEFAGGVDLRGLGLLLAHNKQEVQVRCAAANFKADAGTLIAQNLVADSDPVLITGEGQIHLDSEAIDLVIHGHPKSLRFFRLRSPVLVRGTLAHPAVALQKGKSVPVIVDPGKAKDVDCADLLAEHNSGGSPAQAPMAYQLSD